MGQQLGVANHGQCQDTEIIDNHFVNSHGGRLLDIQETGYNMIGGMGRDWHCLRAEDGPNLEVVDPSNEFLESLSYSPVRFDVASTIDADRSQARYNNLVVHSSCSRVQRRPKDWEAWLTAASGGRNVTILSGFPEDTPRATTDGQSESPPCKFKRTPARYMIDRALNKVSIFDVPGDRANSSSASVADTILVDNVQVICGAADFTLFADHLDAQLDETERRRAVLIQYLKDDGKTSLRRRICFLEATPQDKDRFVQAMTALWLEKRNDGSAWYS